MKNIDKSFKLFSIKLLIFASPIILLIIMAVFADPFRVFWHYDDYYKNNFVTGNREFICLKLYERNAKSIGYDSFIFGSSRSQSFKVKAWMPFLPPGSKGFHFDGTGEGVYGIYNKIRYISETGAEIKNALIILDQDVLELTKNREGYLFISPPKFSKESPLDFYIEFLKPLTNLKFVAGYIDYSFFKTHRKYMKWFFSKQKYDFVSDNLTGDLYYGYDRMIAEDKEAYYDNLVNKGVFYERSKNTGKCMPVTNAEKELLVKIKDVFNKHHTNYRIVISPAYDQIPLGIDHIELLNNIFGAETVHDYSGVNKYTESIYNYYESSHFRPHVAADIMARIYANTSSNK